MTVYSIHHTALTVQAYFIRQRYV